ncbi:GntR family transcriptional regulator [Litorisediminicola beolgyonensis]|uniref:GntR family transcriptional regulator n=1 Tax=Litorisediminicola beolgyonensis TaxID=1173614 RepID=A0ABW3ZJR6_9RHOB
MDNAVHGAKGLNVAETLRGAIQTGRYVPGQRLVEADLTREMGVSRSLLREAFRLLSAEGLVETVPNRGALVKRLSLTEALELFQIRMELEALAARLAADRARNPAVLARFEDDTTEIWSDSPRLSAAAYIAENERFHAAVFRASGNSQLRKLNRQLQLSLIMAQIASSMTPEIIAASIAEHRDIARAIRAGDSADADQGARDHLNRARTFIETMPGDVFRREDEA